MAKQNAPHDRRINGREKFRRIYKNIMKRCLVCYKSLLFEIGGTQDLCEEHKNAPDWYVIGSRFIDRLGREHEK